MRKILQFDVQRVAVVLKLLLFKEAEALVHLVARLLNHYHLVELGGGVDGLGLHPPPSRDVEAVTFFESDVMDLRLSK